MNLHELGWEPFFEQHFASYRLEGFSPARICLEERNQYTAYSELGELTGNVSGRFRHNAQAKMDFPTVGDWVVVKGNLNTQKMTIHGVLPRKSSLLRMMTDKDRLVEEQVISANVDTILYVHGLDRDINLRLIERHRTQAQSSGADLVIVLNKADICGNTEDKTQEAESVAQDIPVVVVSALNKKIEPLRKYVCRGKTVTLVGSSGVGKSTIINTLLGEERQPTGDVSDYNFRGRHITVKRELIILPNGGLIIDNPGIRSLALCADEKEIDESFEDISALVTQCKFRDCQHRTEPGCAVKEALDNGSLDRERYRNYLKLQRELRRRAKLMERKARKRGS